jgi:capsid protein
MIFDDLLPGEKVETIESNRPSNALGPYRDSMLKGVSGGTGARFSTIARTWDSSYTAMRQETVAHKPSTMRLQDYFVARAIKTIYENWLAMAELVGMFDFGRADRFTARDADYRGPGEESIDPLDETKADVLKIQNRLKSRQQIQRERGIDTRRVDAELEADGMSDPTSEIEDETDDETADDRTAT